MAVLLLILGNSFLYVLLLDNFINILNRNDVILLQILLESLLINLFLTSLINRKSDRKKLVHQLRSLIFIRIAGSLALVLSNSDWNSISISFPFPVVFFAGRFLDEEHPLGMLIYWRLLDFFLFYLILLFHV